MKELQPINENVVLELEDHKAEQKTSSGIYIPDSAKKKNNVAKVVAIANIENVEIKVGDYVLYKEYSGVETEYEGKKLLVIQYADILSKVMLTDAI